MPHYNGDDEVPVPQPLHRQIGQLAMIGFEGHALPPEVVSLAREFDLGGVTLFARNVGTPEQVSDIAWRARQLSRDLPLWVGVDQEGGRVARLKAPLTEWPPMMALGRADSEPLAERFATALAREIAALGFSIDFVPVLDVLTNPSNPAIGNRALGEDPERVARLGSAIIRSLQGVGVAACGKHFPGHGDTSVDSHLDLPIVEHPPDRFRGVDFVPFRAAIEAGVTGIMTGHLLVPAFDEERPATLSRAIVQGLLRDELGFDGLVFSDDMDMKAISARIGPGAAAVAAIAAGCDVLLLCGTDVAAHASVLEALARAVEREELPRKRVEEALQRQRVAKGRFSSRKPSADPITGEITIAPLHSGWRPLSAAALARILGRDEHQAIADEMRRYV
ncbi:MAG TPA: beta-N-acetylhexosaminidase [Vicinamibacterales bacterium]|nr:beta-N-acetylhexosaminidase [Vicinamibacterales bacterium]